MAHSAEVGKIVQAIGQAFLADLPVKPGDTVQEGHTLRTGSDGYLYIKTVDNGFFILRPNSSAYVETYHVDPATPLNSRFKIVLSTGVLRSISGQAVKQARQNYRLNTPLAAIGVRGTDFTVFTSEQSTRVAVTSGGVVVSGLGEGCSAAGTGPCEIATRQELFADQTGQILQVLRGQVAPQRLRDATLAPDASAPPRHDEPASTILNSVPDANLTPLKASALEPTLPPPNQPEPTPTILWGRWQALAQQPADFSLPEAMQQGQLVALNSYFALLRTANTQWRMPQEASASFTLRAAQAQVVNSGTGQASTAQLSQPVLTLDFANRRFSTTFNMQTPDSSHTMRAEGNVFADGSFGNTSQYLGNNNMQVQGLLSNSSNLQAGYLFQSRLEDGSQASGVTYWSK